MEGRVELGYAPDGNRTHDRLVESPTPKPLRNSALSARVPRCQKLQMVA